jgi:hypothetical protein
MDTRQGTSCGVQRLWARYISETEELEESPSLVICETHRAGWEGELNARSGPGDSQVGVSRSGSAAVTDGSDTGV